MTLGSDPYMSSRVVSSMLTTLGIPELIAYSNAQVNFFYMILLHFFKFVLSHTLSNHNTILHLCICKYYDIAKSLATDSIRFRRVRDQLVATCYEKHPKRHKFWDLEYYVSYLEKGFEFAWHNYLSGMHNYTLLIMYSLWNKYVNIYTLRGAACTYRYRRYY